MKIKAKTSTLHQQDNELNSTGSSYTRLNKGTNEFINQQQVN